MPGRTGQKPAHAVPWSELSALIGVSEATLRANIKDGAPKPPKTKAALTNWVQKVHAWRKKNIGTFQQQQSAHARAARDPESVNHDRDLKKWRAAEAKLRVAEATRAVVPRKDVIEMGGKAVLSVRQRLNAMVQKMQSRLENVTGDVVVEELQTEVDEICAAFAQATSRMHGTVDGCPICGGPHGGT